MNRRHFLTTTAAIAILPMAASAGETIQYTPGLIQQALAEGKTVFVDYSATWCSTCARQHRVITELRAQNPAYEQMVFVNVDWDTYSRHEVTTSRNIPRRSTLLVLKGDKEYGRIVAGTGVDEIKALLDTGLALTQAS